MRFLLILTLLSLHLGCNKKDTPTGSQRPEKSGSQTPGGVYDAVKGAVTRTVTMADFKNLQLFIDTASTANGKMPTKEEIFSAVKKSDPKLSTSLESGEIIITGSTQRESVWAYERNAESQGGYILTNQGVEKVDAATAKQKISGK